MLMRTLIPSLVLFLGVLQTDSSERIRVRALDGERFEVTIGGEAFTTYHAADGPRPYLWPVLSANGARVTRDYPIQEDTPGEAKDHPHHKSIWFAHGDVNGHDFWHGSDARIVLREVVETKSGKSASLTLQNDWMAGDERICRETRTLRFHDQDGARWIDFDITLHADDKPVTLGDTKEGTMAIRLAPTLRLAGEVAKGSAFNSAGNEGKSCWGKRAEWVAYAGPVGTNEVAVAMFDHPENPSHPTWWHARDYGLFAANPFGVHDFEKKPEGTGDRTIAPGESMRLRYRIAIRDGGVDRAWCERSQATFGKEQ